jgi:hypothetical protein
MMSVIKLGFWLDTSVYSNTINPMQDVSKFRELFALIVARSWEADVKDTEQGGSQCCVVG